VLTTYPSLDASRRLRIDPLVREFESRGAKVLVEQIMTETSFEWKNRKFPFGLLARISTALRIMLRLSQLGRKCDILIIHREAFPFFTPVMERLAASRASVCLLDVDDAIYSKPTHLRDWRSWLRNPKSAIGLKNIANVILCGNEKLLAVFSGGSGVAKLFPTCPEPERSSIHRNPEPKLIWIGSNSTLASLVAVLPQVLEFCEKNAVTLLVLGGTNVESLPPHPHLTAEVWTEQKEIAALSTAIAGLMPLPETEWERGKSSYKAILYLCAGVPSLISPVGENVSLAKRYPTAVTLVEPGAWNAKLAEVIKNRQEGSPEFVNEVLRARDQFDSEKNAKRAADLAENMLRAKGSLITAQRRMSGSK